MAAALLLVGATITAVHWPVLGAQALSFDDNDFITYNPLVTNPGWASVARFFGEVLDPSTVRGYYLPLSMTSLMLDHAAGGRADNLRVYHQTNLALHVLAALLLVLLLHRLFGALIPAAVAALLFGLHPLTVEPVAWIGERKTLLAAVLAFASLLAYIEHCRRRGRAWLPLSVGGFALALLSKPTVTPLPLLLLLLDVWPLNRLRWRTVLEKWPFFLLALASGVITLVSHERTTGLSQPAASNLLHWPPQAAYLLAFYLGRIVWPSNLSCAYQPPTQWTLGNPTVLAGVLVTGALTAVLGLLARRTRGPFVGWAFFFAALVPTMGFVKYSWVLASDKYVYFAAPGILMVLAGGLTAAGRSPRWRGRTARAALLALVAGVCATEAWGVRATLRNWKDSLTLYCHMEKVAPDSPGVHNGMGILLAERAETAEALRHLHRALELAPTYVDAHHNLGLLLQREGQVEESLRHLRRADELRPDDPHTVYNLGIALSRTGNLDAAAAQLRRALRLRPDHAAAIDQLGGVLVRQGRVAEAVEQFRAAVALAPGDPNLRFRLSMALVGLGDHSLEAAELLRQITRDKPDWPEPLNAFAWLLATSPDSTLRRPAQALSLATRAADLTARRDPRVLDTLAAALAAAGQFAHAESTARAALALLPPAGADALAREIRGRLALYRRGSPYTEPIAPAGRLPGAESRR